METQRKQSRVECDVIFNKYESQAMTICRATNISLGGMRVQRLLEPCRLEGARLRLEIELPGDDEPISIGARRVYDDGENDFFGVRFTDISHADFLKLRSWVHDRTIRDELPSFG